MLFFVFFSTRPNSQENPYIFDKMTINDSLSLNLKVFLICKYDIVCNMRTLNF